MFATPSSPKLYLGAIPGGMPDMGGNVRCWWNSWSLTNIKTVAFRVI